MRETIKVEKTYEMYLWRFFADNEDGVPLVFAGESELELLAQNPNLEFTLPKNFRLATYDLMRGIRKGDKMKVTRVCYHNRKTNFPEYTLNAEEYVAHNRPDTIILEERLCTVEN